MKLRTSYFCVAFCILLATTSMATWFQPTGHAPGDPNDHTFSCAWGDYDNDGDMDVFVGNSSGGNGSFLYQNTGGNFTDKAAEAGVQFMDGTVGASCWGDYDNDGYLDLFVGGGEYGTGYKDTLYHNLGPDPVDGKFRFVGIEIDGTERYTKSAMWGDFNNDGWLDLYVVNWNATCKMYKNNQGTLSSFGCPPAIPIQGAYGGIAGDIDNDGDLDIFVTCVMPPGVNTTNKLFRNYGESYGLWDFREEALHSGLQLLYSDCSDAAFCDFDFDGDLDVFIARINGDGGLLYENNGIDNGYVIFEDSTGVNGDIGDHSNISGAGWGDFDLDGDQDLYAARYPANPFYVNRYREGLHDFLEAGADAGVNDGYDGKCTEWADYDADGKPDIYLGNDDYWAPYIYNVLYRNQFTGAPSNRYLHVRLIGAESNRSGVGAHVVLSYLDDQDNRTHQMLEVSGGGSGAGSHGSLPLEFGVGEAMSVDSVMVYWPSGDTSFFEDVSSNQRITIVEHGLFDENDMTWNHSEYGHYYVSGDVTIEDIELEVTEGTHVYFHKTWRYNVRPKLKVYADASLTVTGTVSYPVLFTSQYDTPASGDWEGLYTKFSANAITMDFARVSYANYGLYGVDYSTQSVGSLDINKCRFTNLEEAGIDLGYPSLTSATRIENSYFYDCGSYGIRIRKDIYDNALDVIIDADTVLNCDNGIYYDGNSNIGYTKIPEITDCVIEDTRTGSSGVGIFASSVSTGNPLVSPRIEGNTVKKFKRGVWLEDVNSNCDVIANKLTGNTEYGIDLLNASPTIDASGSGVPNVIIGGKTGMNCSSSSPYVRSTKIRECTSRGVYANSSSHPNFGDALSWGGNSIYVTAGLSLRYADMEYTGLLTLRAVGNWWGEDPPIPWQIIGNIDYSDYLDEDPLPGWKREPSLSNLPDEFSLHQNYPNPFNPSTEISFDLPETGHVSLAVYNLRGRLIKTLVSGNLEGGVHSVIWDGKNSRFEDVATGIYFYVLKSDNGRDSKTMTLLR